MTEGGDTTFIVLVKRDFTTSII